MEKTTLFMLTAAVICFGLPSTALGFHRELSDPELSRVSAGGFDIDIKAVMAFREYAAGLRSQLSKVIVPGMPAIPAPHNASGDTLVQNNVGAIGSTSGDINSALVSNVNEITAKVVSGMQQYNVGAIVALEGSIRDSTILNQGSAGGEALNETPVQVNLGLMFAQDLIENCRIANQVTASVSGEPIESFTYSANDINGIKSLHIAVSGNSIQQNIGVFVSQLGEIISSTVLNSHSD